LHRIVGKFNSNPNAPRKFAESSVRHSVRAPDQARPPILKSGHVMTKLIQTFLRDERGATAIEYGLIAALIAVVIIGAVSIVGTSLSTTFTTVSGSIR
jgi:pilus assembly protein Flp/PilA